MGGLLEDAQTWFRVFDPRLLREDVTPDFVEGLRSADNAATVAFVRIIPRAVGVLAFRIAITLAGMLVLARFLLRLLTTATAPKGTRVTAEKKVETYEEKGTKAAANPMGPPMPPPLPPDTSRPMLPPLRNVMG